MRQFYFAIALIFAPLPALTATAQEPYAYRTLKMIVPFAPGGGIDVVGRTLGQRLSERWATVIREAKIGADQEQSWKW